MRIKDHDRKAGKVIVIPDSADDLWYLRALIGPGDTVTGNSAYKEKLGGADAKTQVVKRRVWVSIAVEKVEWSAHVGRIRVVGMVIDGSEEVPRGSHHGLDVGEGDEITVVKKSWLPYHYEKLDEAARATGARTLVVLFDREKAVFLALRPHGHEILATIEGDVPRKGWEGTGKGSDFMGDIAKQAQELSTRIGAQHIIAASPAFWRAELERALPADVRKRVIFSTISDPDARALPELLGKQEVQAALADERVARERVIVERMLAALGKDKLVYGHADIAQALSEGNLAETVVTETAIAKAREEEKSDEFEALMRKADDVKSAIHLLSTPEACGRIDGLGGIVGVKRW